MLTQSQKLLREHYLTSIKEDTRIIETIVRDTKPKTYAQVKTIFGLAIAQIIAAFDDRGWDSSMLLNMPQPTGVAVSQGLLKEFLYAVCPIYDDNDKLITLSKSDTRQASFFFDDIRNYAASQWNIYIAEPNPNWKEEKSNCRAFHHPPPNGTGVKDNPLPPTPFY